jgi:hypothetical protein
MTARTWSAPDYPSVCPVIEEPLSASSEGRTLTFKAVGRCELLEGNALIVESDLTTGKGTAQFYDASAEEHREDQLIPRISYIRRQEPIQDNRARAQITGLCRACIEKADLLLSENDVPEREIGFASLVEDIRDLKDLRSYREKEFGDLIFLLLSALDHRASEDLSFFQVKAISDAIYPLKRPKLSKMDVSSSRKALQMAGFDIFRMMRGVFDDVIED